MESDVSPAVLLKRDHLLRSLADCCRASGIEPYWSEWEPANGLILRAPVWTERVGLLAAPSGGAYLAYLRPRVGQPSYFPATLVLGLKAGRYSVETRECGAARAAGIEVATAPPLVCGPPCSGRALLLVMTLLE